LVLDVLNADTTERLKFAELFDRRQAWFALGLPAEDGVEVGCLADLLCGMRIQAGLSQDEVAFALKVRQSTISRWEMGEFEPSLDDRQAIASLYRISPEESQVLDSISNREEPLLLRLMRASEPPEFDTLFGTEHVWNYHSDVARLRAVVHQIRRKRVADPAWTELFVVAGEQLNSLYMDTNRLAVWLPYSQRMQASLGSEQLYGRPGQRIIIENAVAHLRAGPLPLSVAKRLAVKAARFLPGEKAWALATAMGIAAEHRDQELVMALGQRAESALRESEGPSYVTCVIARYFRWAGLNELALAVLSRSPEIISHPSSTEMHRAGYFFESAEALAALGSVETAADAETLAEGFVSNWVKSNQNNVETVAIYRANRKLPEFRVAKAQRR
jgi:transcriptional regulator with XRE-family HTH domain